MVNKMQRITEQTLEKIEKRFKTKKGYVLSSENPIYCPQVNGLTNICLIELGFLDASKNNCQSFLESPSYDNLRGLFYREVDLEGRVTIPAFNSCKNSVFALALNENGLKDEAEKVITSLKQSPAYVKEHNLFGREFNPNGDEVNSLIITQSNLWASLAYAHLEKTKESKELIKNLENTRYNQDYGLFESQDCRFIDSNSAFYLDDQALGALVYLKIGRRQKAKDLIETVLSSLLYDTDSGLFNSSFSDDKVDATKSTYKNSLMAFALGRLGYTKELKRIQEGLVRELYDDDERLFDQSTRDKTKIPDNSALALVALEYNSIKHSVF